MTFALLSLLGLAAGFGRLAWGWLLDEGERQERVFEYIERRCRELDPR